MKARMLFRHLAGLAVVSLGVLAGTAVPMHSAWGEPLTSDYRSQYLTRVESRYVDTDLARFHYTRTGTGPPVVLIAGGGLWGYSWREVIPALAADHTVYAVDLPSQGFTELHRADFAYTLPAMSQAIGTFLDALGLDRAAIVGHSWGGAWSLYFAQQHPGRVERLVLLDSPGLDAEKAPVTPLFTTPLLGELATNLTTRSFYAESIRGTFHNQHLVTDEVSTSSTRRSRAPRTVPGFCRCGATWTSGSPTPAWAESARPP